MATALLLSFREGLEAALVLGIVLGVLRRIGQEGWAWGVWRLASGWPDWSVWRLASGSMRSVLLLRGAQRRAWSSRQLYERCK